VGPAPFSLLLPVYGGDRPDFLKRAFESAVTEQSRRPNEVVLVRDGPVSEAMRLCLNDLVSSSPVPARVVNLERNRGLAFALQRGLAECQYDVVARMDADETT
jgi:glycosyltransferase involved in cell wall biosynthesis